MKTLSSYTVPKLAQSLTGGGNSPQLIDNSISRVPQATSLRLQALVGSLGLIKLFSWLRLRILQRPLIKLPAGGFLLILALSSLSAHAGIISTIAGTGTAGYNGDGGTATTAQLKNPISVTFDSSGNLYIADSGNNRIRKVTPGGVISTVAGTGTAGFSGDGGAAISAQLKTPTDVVVDSSGNLYIADYISNRIRQVTPGGVISTIAGTGTAAYNGDGGAATSAQLYTPMAVAVDSSGNLYIADTGNNRIRQITPGGVISTVAGTGAAGYSGDGGAATSAQLKTPIDVAVDSSGNLYIADTYNNCIRQVTPGGVISTVAGIGTAGYSGDGGAATSAELKNPRGVAIDSNGNLYIADFQNQRIRQVTPAGLISTVAGTGTAGFSGDGGVATSAKLNSPYRVAVDSSDNLYIANYSNQRIRKVTFVPTMNVQGNSTSIASGDTTPATTDNTDFGSTSVGTPVSKTFTITNTGDGALNLSGAPLVSVTGSGFSVTTTPTSPVAIVTGTSNFVIQFAPTAIGVSNGMVSIANDDTLNNPYTFSITGLAISSDLRVRQGSTNIPSGGSFVVGPSGIGHHVHFTITIDNTGNNDLILNGTPKIRVSGNNAGEFSVDETSTTSPLGSGGSTTFVLSFIPNSVGAKTATLSLATNDAMNPNYSFTVTGSAEPHKNLQITVSGTGQGSVISDPKGVDCETALRVCSMPVIDAPQWVTLTAVPAAYSMFIGWSGDPACQTDGKILVITDTACTATFGLKNYQLTANFLGKGRVTGPGIDCPGQCTAIYLYGTTVTLKAQATRKMWDFSGWRGCDSQGTIQITQDVLCQAVFTPDPNIPNTGDGNGDGLPDAYQDNVVSLPDKVTGTYLTFEVQPATCVISDIYPDLPETQTVKVDHTKKFPQGLLYFDIACPQAQVSVYYHAMSKVYRNLKFYKFGPKIPGDLTTLAWYPLPNIKYELVTVGGKPVVKGTYTLKDGELGDSTGVDGHIVDPGGLVYP